MAGFDWVLSSMFPLANASLTSTTQIDSNYLTKATKLKDAAKKRSEQVKAQAEQIYQNYSVKN